MRRARAHGSDVNSAPPLSRPGKGGRGREPKRLRGTDFGKVWPLLWAVSRAGEKEDALRLQYPTALRGGFYFSQVV